jgi:hypothetical protein
MTFLARILLILALSLTVAGTHTGCRALAFLLTKTVGPFVPEDEVQAQYEFKSGSVLILIDAKDPSLTSDYPQLRSRLTDIIGKTLTDKKACGPVVPSRSVEAARRAEPHFADWSFEQAGTYFNVDYVVHIEILEFRLEDVSGSNAFSGYTEASVRIFDPNTGERVWPVLSEAKVVTAETTPIVEASQPSAREEVLVEGFGEKIARLFYTYKTGDLPIRPKVK